MYPQFSLLFVVAGFFCNLSFKFITEESDVVLVRICGIEASQMLGPDQPIKDLHFVGWYDKT